MHPEKQPSLSTNQHKRFSMIRLAVHPFTPFFTDFPTQITSSYSLRRIFFNFLHGFMYCHTSVLFGKLESMPSVLLLTLLKHLSIKDTNSPGRSFLCNRSGVSFMLLSCLHLGTASLYKQMIGLDQCKQIILSECKIFTLIAYRGIYIFILY